MATNKRGSTIFPSLTILLLITYTNTSPGLQVRAQDCKPWGLITGQQPPLSQCGAEADSSCCVPGQNYTAYRCSPPVTNRTEAVMFVSGFQDPTSCENKHYSSNDTLVVAISGGWFSNGSRCDSVLIIKSNSGRTTEALVVDECNSYVGCDAENGYQPPCSNDELVASEAVWAALGVSTGSESYGKMNVTWSMKTVTSPLKSVRSTLLKRNKIIVVVPVAIVVLFIIISLVVDKLRLRWYPKEVTDQEQWENPLELLSDHLPKRISFKDLKRATDNFNEHRKLGVGGFGSVFKGVLNDNLGTRIAVKRLDNLKQGKKEFVDEATTTGTIHHFNLVKLIGFCVEKRHKLLVYEYMSNGSLDRWIFGENKGSILWDLRKMIILHIAKGLSYLHEDCKSKILHLDIKPQNILLDHNFNAKLADFGLSKMMAKDQRFAMTHMKGTPGYLAPEWLSGKITEKVDVYSYGMVMIEVMFERRNADFRHLERPSLVEVVREKAETCQLSNLIEEHHDEDMRRNLEDVERMIKLAICCLQTDPVRRPSMSTVVKVLEGAMILEPVFDSPDANSPSPDVFGEISSLRTFEISAITCSR